MKSTCVIAVLAMGLVAAAPEARQWHFDDAVSGKLPAGWVAAKTGEGPGSVWQVIEDESAPSGKQVLAQVSGEGPRALFNLCFADKPKWRDVQIDVSIKAVTGEIDRGGGPVWRLLDADNYYVARINPLENNFRVYKVVDGKRTQLATADVELPTGQWQQLRIVHVGNHIRCYLDEKLYLDVHDGQFSKPGKAGLWTKADAVTRFDDFRVSVPQQSAGQ